MKTTLIIDDGVMARLKKEAVDRKTTISRLVESALRMFLEEAEKPAKKLRPLPVFHLGGELVDISDREALYKAMEEE